MHKSKVVLNMRLNICMRLCCFALHKSLKVYVKMFDSEGCFCSWIMTLELPRASPAVRVPLQSRHVRAAAWQKFRVRRLRLASSIYINMNNSQFRRLLVDAPKQQEDGSNKSPVAGMPKAAVLGARKHSSIPMTP